MLLTVVLYIHNRPSCVGGSAVGKARDREAILDNEVEVESPRGPGRTLDSERTLEEKNRR